MTTVLVDTSVAVPLVLADHDDHAAFTAHVGGLALGLAGHAAFETFSVLTRLPAPLRRRPAVVAELLNANFPSTVHLSSQGASDLMTRLAPAGVAGGAVYDALVAAAATEAGMRLLSADQRAAETYRALGVEFELLA